MNSTMESNGVYRDQTSLSYDSGSRESKKVQCNKCGEVYCADELKIHIRTEHGNDSSNVEDETMNPSLQNSSIKGQRRRRGKWSLKENSEKNTVSEDQITECLAKMDISHSETTSEQYNTEEVEQHFNTAHYSCEIQVDKARNVSGVANGSGKPRQASKRKSKKGSSKADAELMEVCKICHRKYERKFAQMHYKLMHSEVQLEVEFGQLETSPRMRLGQRKAIANTPKPEEDRAVEEENQPAYESHVSEGTGTPSTVVKKLSRRNNRKKMTTSQGKSLETCSICQHHYLIPFASFHYKIMHPEISFTEEMEKMDDLNMSMEEPRQRNSFSLDNSNSKEETVNQQQPIKGRLSKKKKRRKLSALENETYELCTLCDKKYDKQFAILHFEVVHGGRVTKPETSENQAMDNGAPAPEVSGGEYNAFEDSSSTVSYGQDPNTYEQDNMHRVQCGIRGLHVNIDEAEMHYGTAHSNNQ